MQVVIQIHNQTLWFLVRGDNIWLIHIPQLLNQIILLVLFKMLDQLEQ